MIIFFAAALVTFLVVLICLDFNMQCLFLFLGEMCQYNGYLFRYVYKMVHIVKVHTYVVDRRIQKTQTQRTEKARPNGVQRRYLQ